MALKLPKGLPECGLVTALTQRAEEKQDTDFDFIGHLEAFRKRVTGEVSQINVLFPEYTPHNEQYHLRRLFHVASTVLGVDGFEEMNCAELYVLAVALYGHDWGMAVSDTEKSYIVRGECPNDIHEKDLWILPDEQARLLSFARENRLPIEPDNQVKDISTDAWGEYVRQTHAFRSAERVRRYFESIDGGVAEAASRVCLGHWLDFEKLQNHNAYPPDFAVQGDAVNLRALAVYVRLIDLLDLSEDRTPYIIWKFVSPRNPTSRMEWKKHRSLRPVTCRPYQEGRVIQVDGSTNDHEVYAALEDFRNYCEEQLRGCNDLLARMNDPRHHLNIYHIDWRVAPRGFNPVLIRFEFDRQRMFDVLSDEIYQGDSYVFLRELLQNSIDAIRMRREVLARQGLGSAELGVIRFEVEHQEDGGAVVTCCDDGIGMDEYVIRNYLAIAGKSYYRSEDFERQGLSMDPISRFGVGILSCFMVAEKIEIESHRDPYLSPVGYPLRVVIPSVDRQFRIEALPRETARVGTSVRVFVDARKISRKLDVTAYIKALTGFVEFPVIISEDDKRTIVIHAQEDTERVRARFGEDFDIYKLDMGFPWSETFLPQDLSEVRGVLTEEQYNVGTDLELPDYEGVLSFLVPSEKDMYLSIPPPSLSHNNLKIVDRRSGGMKEIEIRLKEGPRQQNRLSRSVGKSFAYAVYKDGILIPQVAPPSKFGSSYSHYVSFWNLGIGLPNPRLIVNLKKQSGSRLDLARLSVRDDSEHWGTEVFSAFLRHLSEVKLKPIEELVPIDRLFELAKLMWRYKISADDLWQVFPHEKWPIVCLEPGGSLRVYEWPEVCSGVLFQSPNEIYLELSSVFEHTWTKRSQYTGPLSQWVGDRCLTSTSGYSYPINKISNICETPVMKTYSISAIRFLNPPWQGDPPIVQEVMTHAVEDRKELNTESILRGDRRKSRRFRVRECDAILNANYYSFPRVFEFPAPFEQHFAYGKRFLNANHPATQALVWLVGERVLAERDKMVCEAAMGRFDDALRAWLSKWKAEQFSTREWSRGLREVCRLAREMGLPNVERVLDNIPQKMDFVPGTLGKEAKKQFIFLSDIKRVIPFGRCL